MSVGGGGMCNGKGRNKIITDDDLRLGVIFDKITNEIE